MKNDEYLTNNNFYLWSKYITNFFITNFYFLLCISPLVIYKFLYNGTSKTITLVLSFTIAPAITALFSTIGKFIREKNIEIVDDFFRFYKMNFSQSLVMGIIFNILIGLMYFDFIYFLANKKSLFMILIILMTIVIVLIMMYAYLIISRYNVKVLYILKTSLLLTVKKFHINLTCLASTIIFLWIIRTARISLIGVLFGASLISYIILKLQIPIIDELENSIKEKYGN